MSPVPTPATFPPRMDASRERFRQRSAAAQLEDATRRMEELAASGRPAGVVESEAMKPTILAVSAVLLLSACASAPTMYAQAVPLPAPVEAPMVEPSFPHPGYTPNGAGLPGERVLGQPSPEVKHSKNWRPGGAHPEMMAPDDAPMASGIGATVLGVHFDLGLTLKPARAAQECAKAVNEADASTIHWSKHTSTFSEEAMRCIAARAFLRCATSVRDELQSKKRMFADVRAEHAAEAAAAVALWEKKYCDGVPLDHTQNDYLSWLISRSASIRPKQ